MSYPKVSIIIPVYNTVAYLQKCLDSVLGQTYKDIELILINDGSTDGSDILCQNYANKDSRVRYFSRANAGVSATRNFGIKQASGKYIFFLDSDDYIEETCIKILVDTIYNTSDLIVSGYKLCERDGGNVTVPEQSSGSYANIGDFAKDFYKFFATKSNFAWGKLYDAEIIKTHDLQFPEDIYLVEDLLFNLQYYSNIDGRIVFLSSNDVIYRQISGNSLSRKLDNNTFNWLDMYYQQIRLFLADHDALDQNNLSAIGSNLRSQYAYFISKYLISSDEHIIRKVRRIRQILKTSQFNSYRYTGSRFCFGKVQQYLLQHKLLYTYSVLTLLRHKL